MLHSREFIPLASLRSLGCHLGMLRSLALVIINMAEKVDRFFASQMGWSEDVCSTFANTIAKCGVRSCYMIFEIRPS